MGLSNGTHTVQAIAYDTSSNSATNGVSVVVSNETHADGDPDGTGERRRPIQRGGGVGNGHRQRGGG